MVVFEHRLLDSLGLFFLNFDEKIACIEKKLVMNFEIYFSENPNSRIAIRSLQKYK